MSDQSKGRHAESQAWSFPPEDEPNDTSPVIEMICQLLWFVKFIGFGSLFFFCVFCAWAVFEYFYASTACMILQALSSTCK